MGWNMANRRKRAVMAIKKPVHPGRIVRTECLESTEMSVTDAARHLGVTRQALNNLVNEKAALSPEMSVRLEKLGWGSAEAWLRLQMNHDLARVRAREDEIVVQAPLAIVSDMKRSSCADD